MSLNICNASNLYRSTFLICLEDKVGKEEVPQYLTYVQLHPNSVPIFMKLFQRMGPDIT
jgi:hypothetical protein